MAEILMVTELFPPAIGGTAVMFENVYRRVEGIPVSVLADSAASKPAAGSAAERDSQHEGASNGFRHLWTDLNGRHRGIAGLDAMKQHFRVAGAIRRASRGRRVVVHCGRVQPEGIAGMLSGALPGGSKFLCWAMGEEIAASMMSREYRMVMDQVYKRAAAVLSITANTKKLLESIGVAGEKIAVVHPGVDVSRFRGDVDGRAIRERLIKPGELMLLSVGRLQRRKGHDTVIAALAQLRDAPFALRYVIVGHGEEHDRLVSLAQQHGVADRVHFEGAVDTSLLPSYYAACDIFLMPNRLEGQDFEGFGIVFLEAAAAGKPTIGGTTGGSPEAIAAGQDGLLVEGKDPAELAAVIRTLAESAELRQRFGAFGRIRASRDFSWERAARLVTDVHRRVAGQ
jgi:phosphatidyl-myo-inositol dimannoside synthase